jgi:chromosome segregation ATPase
MTIQGATIQGTPPLAAAELAATPAQQNSIANSCAASALQGLTQIQKQGMASAIQSVQATIAQALDVVQARRTRITSRQQALQAQINSITGSNSNINALYGYAGNAAATCPDVSNALSGAKEASDFVNTRLIELQYQVQLCTTANESLASQQVEFNSSLNELDNILLLLGA